MQVPEVAGASIRRILPDTVEIDFTLRRPFFQSYRDGQYLLLDADGLELGRAAECPAGLVALRAGDRAAVEAIAALSPGAAAAAASRSSTSPTTSPTAWR